ncbi:MAG TPA: hypothetical protein VMR81_04790 [Patescibacteria group bacterium]|nr:hypothetical protein [Patescibacteria group bacterium]
MVAGVEQAKDLSIPEAQSILLDHLKDLTLHLTNELDHNKRLDLYTKLADGVHSFTLPTDKTDELVGELFSKEASVLMDFLSDSFYLVHDVDELINFHHPKRYDMVDDVIRLFPEVKEAYTNKWAGLRKHVDENNAFGPPRLDDPITLKELFLAKYLGADEADQQVLAEYVIHDYIMFGKSFGRSSIEHAQEVVGRVFQLIRTEWSVPPEGVKLAAQSAVNQLHEWHEERYQHTTSSLGEFIERLALVIDPREVSWRAFTEQDAARACNQELLAWKTAGWRPDFEQPVSDDLEVLVTLKDLAQLDGQKIVVQILPLLQDEYPLISKIAYKLIDTLVPEEDQKGAKYDYLQSLWKNRWEHGAWMDGRRAIRELAMEEEFVDLVSKIDTEGFNESALRNILSQKQDEIWRDQNLKEKARLNAAKRLLHKPPQE